MIMNKIGLVISDRTCNINYIGSERQCLPMINKTEMSHMIKLFVIQHEHIDQRRSTHVKLKGRTYLTVTQIKVVE